MRKLRVLILFLIFLPGLYISARELPVQYISPLPESKFNNRETSIIIRTFKRLNENTGNLSGRIIVEGTLSGYHKGEIIFSADGQTLIFKPERPFTLSETVNVTLKSPITGNAGTFEYSFHIKDKILPPSGNFNYTPYSGYNQNYSKLNYAELPQSDSLPIGFPVAVVTTSVLPSPGKIFLTNYSLVQGFNTYIMIFNNDGSPFYYKQMEGPCTDFKKISNGNLVYYQVIKNKYYELDSNYNVIDSFYTGNGYTTDQHELVYLNNGNAYLMAYDTVFVNMNVILPGADTNAMVIGTIIQEIDKNKNVIFQWRSWDHIPITDCANQDLFNDTIDYVHGNALEQDNDGNILLSSRHLNEITKINRISGNIMWRLGGLRNQFTFLNDSLMFNFQHDIRRQKNGNISLYDNGNSHNPPFSRAVEYEIDEQAKTARLVWQYRNTPDAFGMFMGNVQRLDNGNSVIGWGGTFGPIPTVTEISSTGEKLFEMYLPVMVVSYRAYRFDWDYQVKTIIPSSYSLYQNYPNPFNPITSIEFDIPEAQFVNLTVFDILGRKVATLVNEKLEAKRHKYEWNASGYSSGIYFYRLTGANFSETKRMMLIK